MIIAILGPDGTGKTTLADAICDELAARDIASKHYPLNFGILPKLSTFKNNRQAAEDEMSSTEFDIKPNHPIKSFIYVSWYALDYFLGGVWLKFKKFRTGRQSVAVFARYYHDYYYQSNNRALPSMLKDVLGVLVPKPTLVLFIERDGQSIHLGKPELPVYEIEFQQKLLQKKFSKNKNFHRVDGSVGKDATIMSAMEIVDKFL